MEQENKIEQINRLVLYDPEEEYACLFSEYLKRSEEVPWNIHTYTEREEVLREDKGMLFLLVAESAYEEQLKSLEPKKLILLNESGVVKWEQFANINKYQAADNVIRQLWEIYAECSDSAYRKLQADYKANIIGIYSPIKRCMQTSFALTMAQILSKDYPVLYLNFEHYAGDGELVVKDSGRDLSDLLFFLSADKEKFPMRFRTVVRRIGSMDYIPPMRSGQNLLTIQAKDWISLLERLDKMSEYAYIIMDLTDSMQGLFDILRLCHKVFTLTANDRMAKSKLLQYEQLLEIYAYDDILKKTEKCTLPRIERLPDMLEQYTRGDLADYVREQLRTFING